MNIDSQNSKSDQIFSHKYLVRPRQSDPGQYPGKSGPSRSFDYLILHILKFYSMVVIIPNYFKNI